MKTTFSITKKDLEVTWFSGTGAGGQHRNKHQNCIRIRHPETGVIVTGQSHRSRAQNQREAMQSLGKHPKIRAFLEYKLREIETGITIEQWVEEQMHPNNLKIEYRDEDGKWITRSMSLLG